MGAQAVLITMLFGMVLIWYYYLAKPEEIELYYDPIFKAFVNILIGFIFFRGRFPERFMLEEKYGPRLAYFS